MGCLTSICLLNIGLFMMIENRHLKEFQPHIYCNVGVGILGAAAVGVAAKSYAASKAADAQTAAANNASQYQAGAATNAINAAGNLLQNSQQQLQPYQNIGATAANQITNQLPLLTNAPAMDPEMLALQKPLNIDQATLETLPGYQFAKTQGLKAVQNSAAARGLGVSGAALKGAATFATGLADSNFNNYFNQEQQNVQNSFGRYQTVYGNQLTTQGNAFNRLTSLLGTGADAAKAGVTANTQTGAITGNIATNNASQVGSNMIGAGNAVAAADNSIGNAVATGANQVGGYAAYKGLYGNSSGTSGTGSSISDAAIY